jgi:hypothetical protein
MFRVLVLQALYTLSDDQIEYQLRDRLSFMRFAGLALEDAVPDAKTVWLYREQLTRAARWPDCSRASTQCSPSAASWPWAGEGWSKARTRQIDRDGRWTIKRGRKAKPPPEGTPRRLRRHRLSQRAVPA